MCKIIAIANQKGGVGKTTTTSNLGIGLAKHGKKVLLIDADAQGSLTDSLGFTEPDKLEETLATALGNIINDEDMETDYGILKHKEGIDLMPGNIEISGLEVSLVNVMSRELVMRSYIELVKDNYDYILIDCMPSLGMITINAFACADSILIPVQAAYLPAKGLQQLIKTIGKVRRQINPKLMIEGILLTMVDARTNYAKDITALLVENYGSKVRIFENSIPISVRAAEISAEGVSIYEHDPKGKVDRKRLRTPNGVILGTPGSGKSFSAKREILSCFLMTKDDIVVCDPEGEYFALVGALHGQVVRLATNSKDYLNPMDIQLSHKGDCG